MALAASLIPLAGLFQVFDGIQAVAVGILRGAGDTRWPMMINILGFWLVGVPISIWLGFYAGYGPTGLWWGFVAGLAAVALLLLWRVRTRFRSAIARVRGPLCTLVRRWGFPYSPIHPVFTPARINVDVEYRFYSGLPWFHKIGAMTATKDVEVEALRDDEWVFSGQSFTDLLWMSSDGKMHTGPVDPKLNDDIWAIGFCNPGSRDSFVGLFLDHHGDGLPPLKHNANPLMFYRWHGQCWSRYPLPGKIMPAGAVLHQKNAYAAIPYDNAEGPKRLEDLRRRLVSPYTISPGVLTGANAASEQPGRLARAGEAGDSPISKKALWEALQRCKDEQLYVTDTNVVDLGLVYDIRVRGDVVHLIMAMPHRGRPRLGFFTYGSGGNATPVRLELMKVPGVSKVVVEQTWEPGWNSNRITATGRRKLGLDT